MAQIRLDRKTLWVLTLGALVIALLVFLAGYLVGLNSTLADPVEPGEPPVEAADSATLEPPPEDLPEIPVRSPMEPEPAADEPVPLDDSEPPREEPPQEAEEAPPEGGFTIQLGAFREEEHARGLRAELLDLGWDPEVIRLDDPVLGELFKVRVGRYTSFDEARDVADQIRVQAGHDAWAVRADG